MGETTSVTEEHLRSFSNPLSVWHLNTADTDDQVIYQSIIPPNAVSDITTPLLDVAATSTTDATGQVALSLGKYTGGYPTREVAAPAHIVATARTSSPFIVTAINEIVSADGYSDLQITFFTWKADGRPAPNVEFDWRCWVATTIQI